MSAADVPTPEHDKLRALDGANDTVGEFLDWLQGQGLVIAKYGAPYEMQVFVSYKNMGRSEKLELKDLIEQREVEAIGEWLDDHDYADAIHVGSPNGWGDESFAQRYALPDPEVPECCWYIVEYNEERLTTADERFESLIGRFFDIDPRKLSDEKDALLAAIRAA